MVRDRAKWPTPTVMGQKMNTLIQCNGQARVPHTLPMDYKWVVTVRALSSPLIFALSGMRVGEEGDWRRGQSASIAPALMTGVNVKTNSGSWPHLVAGVLWNAGRLWGESPGRTIHDTLCKNVALSLENMSKWQIKHWQAVSRNVFHTLLSEKITDTHRMQWKGQYECRSKPSWYKIWAISLSC